MRKTALFPLTVAMLFACTAQARPSESAPPTADSGTDGAAQQKVSRMRIIVGSKVFPATLNNDSPAASAFKAMLPLTVDMADLNANEKFVRLGRELPRAASNPRTISTGDLMLYGADTLVLFYKSFSTSYTYTRLGKVDDPAALAAAVGSGSVTITFER